jgi:hypothetical protein
VDISKGRKSENVEDRTTLLGDLFYTLVQAIKNGPAPGYPADQPPAVPDANGERMRTANRYQKLKTGVDVPNEAFDAMMAPSYRPSGRPNTLGTFVRDQNPKMPDARPLPAVSAAHFPWQEDKQPLSRDEGRIYTHTGPTKRR